MHQDFWSWASSCPGWTALTQTIWLTILLMSVVNFVIRQIEDIRDRWDAPNDASDTTIIARLGYALYWIGCIAAVVMVWVGIVNQGGMIEYEFLAMCAVIFWGSGRLCRYVLAGT
jgi:hypothetical protein